MPQSTPIRLAVLLSGSGTTLQNLIDRTAAKQLDANIVLVISNKQNAYGLERATNAGIPTAVVNRKNHETVEQFSDAVFQQCRNAKVDLICLAGFMQLLHIPDDFTNRVMNVHPALIPAFCGKGYYGRRVHQAVLDYGAKLTGCTVHFADNIYDNGPIILQRAIPVLEEDTVESLAARVQELERECFPEAIQLFAEGRLRVEGRIVRIKE